MNARSATIFQFSPFLLLITFLAAPQFLPLPLLQIMPPAEFFANATSAQSEYALLNITHMEGMAPDFSNLGLGITTEEGTAKPEFSVQSFEESHWVLLNVTVPSGDYSISAYITEATNLSAPDIYQGLNPEENQSTKSAPAQNEALTEQGGVANQTLQNETSEEQREPANQNGTSQEQILPANQAMQSGTSKGQDEPENQILLNESARLQNSSSENAAFQPRNPSLGENQDAALQNASGNETQNPPNQLQNATEEGALENPSAMGQTLPENHSISAQNLSGFAPLESIPEQGNTPDRLNVTYSQGLEPDFSNLQVRFVSQGGLEENISFELLAMENSSWAQVKLFRAPGENESISILALQKAESPPTPSRAVLKKGSSMLIASARGNIIEADDEVLSLLSQNQTVRVLAKSQVGINWEKEEGKSTLFSRKSKQSLPQKFEVLEIASDSLGQLADIGVENIYLDRQMSVSLADTVPLIGADSARNELNYTGSGITICLLDTGVDFSLPSFEGKAVSGFDFINSDTDASDDNGHGTSMASVIHAIAPNATILSVKVLDSSGTGYSSDIISGIDYCRQLASGGAIRIISMSFGGGNFTGYCDEIDAVAQETSSTVAEGLLAVASTGNNGAEYITSPACAQNATAVSSTTKQDTVSSFSNMNALVDLLAPGENVAVNGATVSGTSISAAHVSGAAALLLQSDSSLAPSEAEHRLKSTGTPIEHNGANYSRIDIYNAIENNITIAPSDQTANESTGNESSPPPISFLASAITSSSARTDPNGTQYASSVSSIAGYCNFSSSTSSSIGYNYTWWKDGAVNSSGVYSTLSSFPFRALTGKSIASGGGAVTFTAMPNTSYVVLATGNGTPSSQFFSIEWSSKQVGQVTLAAEHDAGTAYAAVVQALIAPIGRHNLSTADATVIIYCNTSTSTTPTFSTAMPSAAYKTFCLPTSDADSPRCTVAQSSKATGGFTLTIEDDGDAAEVVSSTNYCAIWSNSSAFSIGSTEFRAGWFATSALSLNITLPSAFSTGDYAVIMTANASDGTDPCGCITSGLKNATTFQVTCKNDVNAACPTTDTIEYVAIQSAQPDYYYGGTANATETMVSSLAGPFGEWDGWIFMCNASDGSAASSQNSSALSLIPTPSSNVTLPYPLETKLQNGVNVSTSDLGTQIYPDYSLHYYALRIPSISVSTNLNASHISATLSANDIYSAKIYPIITETPVNLTYGEELFNETSGAYYNLSYNSTSETIYGLGSPTNSLSTSLTRNWMLELNSSPMREGSFNFTVGALTIDPSISACGTLNGANSVHTLTASVTNTTGTCFTMNATNVTLDCAGYTVTGSNVSGKFGVYSNQAQTKVRNCLFRGWGAAVYLNTSASSSNVSNNSISAATGATGNPGATVYGIYAASASNNISNNTISSLTGGVGQASTATRNGGAAYGIAVAGAGNNLSRNIISSIRGGSGNNATKGAAGAGGSAYGISATAAATLPNNTISSITGGAGGTGQFFGFSGYTGGAGGSAYGISSSGASTNISAGSASSIVAGNGGSGGGCASLDCSGSNGGAGGSAYGAYLSASTIRVSNISFSTMTAGSGGTGGMSDAEFGTGADGGAGGSAYGAYLTSSSSDTLANSSYSAATAGSGGDGGAGGAVSGNGGNGGSAYSLYFTGSASGSVINNTLGSLTAGAGGSGNTNGAKGANNSVLLTGASGANTFYWNNFTNIAGAYLNDTNGTNKYNSSTEGNRWHNVINGSVAITGASLSSGFPSLYIGTTGAGYPYNNSTSQSKFICNFASCADFHPLTPTQTSSNTAPTIFAISVIPASPTVETNISCNVTVRDPEQSATNITFEWYKNGANQTALAGTFNNAANNTATLISNLTVGNLSVGQNWSCRARAYDGSSYSSWNMSSNVTIADSATVAHCRNLTTAGTTYTLQNSVSINGATCFNITAANIVLNCNGYSISGNNSTSTYGIYSNQRNSSITRCTISNFASAILFSGASNGTINSTIANTTRASASAINLTSSSNNTIRNVTAYSLSGSAISLESSSSKTNITNTSATGSSGISISSSNNSFISGNSVAGISLTSSGYSDMRHTASTKGITLSSSSNYNNLTNVTVSSGSATSLTIQSSSASNRFYNSSFTSSTLTISLSSSNSNYFSNASATTTSSATDAVSVSSSSYTAFTGSTFTAASDAAMEKSGLYLYNSNLSNFTGNTIRNIGGDEQLGYDFVGYGAYISGGSGHIFANNTLETVSWSSTDEALAIVGVSDSQFINNTLQAAGGATLAELSGASDNNTFYWNNFTSATRYFNDTSSGTNYLNTSNSTTGKGNIWNNVISGSVIVRGTIPVEWLSGFYYASSGTGYPYNSTTSGGKIIGTTSIADYAPITPPHSPTIAYQLSFSNHSAKHSFNVSAGVTDLDGSSDVNFTNISTSAGTCAYLSNSTAGNNFNVTYNCTATSPATPSIVIGFKDKLDGYVQTSSASNAYPDHAASLTSPSVTSPLYADSTATCTAGTFSDIDSDTENTSARTWSWYRNGTIISGQAASTLSLSAIGILRGENVSCRQNATNSTWPSSNATALSSNVTVSNSLPSTSVPTLSPTTAYKNTSQISCANGTTSDADGDAVSFYYLWYKNSTSTGITTQNITNSSYNKGDRLVCQITPYDGTSNGTSQNSSSVTISNTAPTTSAPTLSPSPAHKNTSRVSCINGTTLDIDGDTVNFYYLWYKNGTSTGITTQNITNSSYNKGDQLTCEITPYNTGGSGGESNDTRNGSIFANDATVGTFTWVDPSNASASDNNYTNAGAMSDAPDITKYLKATDFGFSISEGSTINGIIVEYESTHVGDPNWVQEYSIKLVKGGTISGANRADPAKELPTSDAYMSVGNSSDLWNLTWSSSDINAADFGAALSFLWFSDGGTMYVDHVRITVNYTESTAANGTSQNSSALTITNAAPAVTSSSINSTLFSGSPVLYTSDTMRGFCRAIDGEAESVKYWWAFYKNGTAFSNGSTTNYTHGTEINVANITGSDVKSSNWTLECKADDTYDNSTAVNSTQLNLTSCFGLSTTGQTYTLNENAATSGATCYNVSAANITLNCAGYSVTGNNTTNTYGAYSNSTNTTLQSCAISNFQHGIYLSYSNSSTISGTSASTTHSSGSGIYLYFSSFVAINSSNGTSNNQVGIFLQASSNSNNITNSRGTSVSGKGISIDGSSSNTISNSVGSSTSNVGIDVAANSAYTTISNSNGTSDSSHGIYIFDASDSSNITDSRGTSSSGYGIFVTENSGSTITRSTGTSTSNYGIAIVTETGAVLNSSTGTSTSGTGIYLEGISSGTIANSTGNSTSGSGIFLNAASNPNTIRNVSAVSNSSYALYILSSSGSTVANSSFTSDTGTVAYFQNSGSFTVYNNTLASTNKSALLLFANGSSGANTFYWNNFTNTSGAYLNDTNGTNKYNSSTEGNIWFNVQNGSVAITGTVLSSGFAGQYIGSAGAGYPYNNSTSSSKFSCSFAGCADYTPLTPTQAGGNTAPSIFAIAVVPSSPTIENNISCNVTVRDPEQSATNITFEWYKNGANQTALAGTFNNAANNTATLISNLTVGNLSVGQNWSCRARAYDGTDYSSWNMSANVTIADSATVTMCRNLTTAGQTYTMQNNVAISGATCFNVTAANISLNCAGYSITGNNASGTNGIYSSQFNTTISSCNISNFSIGIQFAGATNGTIQSNNVSNSNSTGIFFNATAANTALTSNRLCSNSLDINSSNSSNAGSLDSCDSFSGWSEGGHSGCAFACTSLWHMVFGNVSGNLSLATNATSPYVYVWPSVLPLNVYLADYDASINWQQLQPIGKNTSGSSSSNDFAELDLAFGTGAYLDNITATFSTNGTAPITTSNFTVFARNITSVPVAPSFVYNTAFKTGILWDASDGGSEFSNSFNQSTVWVVRANSTAVSDTFGNYQYLGQIPFKLSTYEGGNSLVSIYAELE